MEANAFVLKFTPCAVQVLLTVLFAPRQSKSPGIDIAFLVDFRRAEVRDDEDNNGSGSMTVATRIKFEKLKAEADEMILRSREKQVRPYAYLAGMHFGVPVFAPLVCTPVLPYYWKLPSASVIVAALLSIFIMMQCPIWVWKHAPGLLYF